MNLPDEARGYVKPLSARLLVAVGQPAAEALQGLRARIVYAMVPSPPVGIVGTNSSVSPRDALAALRMLPDIRHVGVIYSRQGLTKMVAARPRRERWGVELHDQLIRSSPDAIRAIHSLVWGRTDGNQPWDAESRCVVGGARSAGRRHAAASVFADVAVDGAGAGAGRNAADGVTRRADEHRLVPRRCGENLALQVNQILDDPNHYELLRDHPVTPPDIIINGPAARRLGVRLEPFIELGWKVHE